MRTFEIGVTSRTSPAVGELLDERRVLDRAEAVADPVGLEQVERGAHGLGADDLAGVRDGAEARPRAAARNAGAKIAFA